ncbi:MAG: HAMP domain-containing protein, partial [Aquificaceae bacterium]|nr:HAMP domain-containing protein [Aquificaceae bacterium]
MSVRFKALLLFFSLYMGSVFLLSVFSLIVIRTTLYQYVLNYVDYQVNPLMEFYNNYYKNPNQYALLLSEDVVSREIASMLLDKKGNVINIESFLEGEIPHMEEDEIRKVLKLRRGIGERYAFIVKRVGDYDLILLGKLDSIKRVEGRILLFTGILVLLISAPASVLAFLLINRLLKPLSYLRYISESLSRGELDIEIERGGRRDEFGLLEEAYANMVEKLKGIILWQREFIRNITHALKTPLAYIR